MSTRIPKYRKHRSGQARVTFAGKTFYLGKHGTPESRQRYKALVNEWLTRTGRFTPADTPPSPANPLGATVNEVILAYLKHAREDYQTNPVEVEKITLAVRPLRLLYGRTHVAAFDSLALEAVPSAMVESGLARSTANERVSILKRLFKWGVRKKLVPAAVFGELVTVEGHKRGRTKARETDPVTPVPEEHIGLVLPLVSRHVRGMIQLQLLTGARPGEICILRRADIDTTGAVWVDRPHKHKNAFRGFEREIYLGPKAQEVVRAFFQPDRDAYLFSPKLAREERYQELRAKRRSKVTPSRRCRRKADAKRLPGDRYTTYSYRKTDCAACKKAGVPPWQPNRLRRNAGTNLRKEFGVELARIILGHKTAFTTEIYAEADTAQAVEVIARIG